MGQEQFLHDIERWLVNIVFWTSLTFPLITRLYWDWTASWWGRNIVALECCIATTLLAAVLYMDWGVDSLALRWISDLSLALVSVIVVQRAYLIWKAQRTANAVPPEDNGGV